jgi:hypothetical protein
MGLKLQGVLRCGACGKPRGLSVHVCNPGARRRRRTTLRNPVTWECGTCGKPRGLRHTCKLGGDFKARKRKAAAAAKRAKKKAAAAARAQRRKERRKRAAAERRARDRARKQAAKTRPRTSRPRGDSHEPGSCGDRACERYRCQVYWRGMDDCPIPHEGES